jgi:Protein of unknown function (DUF3168)
MTPEVAIRTRLINDPAVSALVGTRIYPDQLPQAPTYPALVYIRASCLPDGLTQDAHVGPARPRIQIDSWSESRSKTDEVYLAVKACLHGMAWATTDGDQVQLVAHESDNDLGPASEDASSEPGTPVVRRSADYRVIFRKAG